MRASANASDKDGETPLLVAVRSSDNATAQLLFWAGAAPNVSDLFGEAALMEAAGIGNTDYCQILLGMHADIMQANEVKLPCCGEALLAASGDVGGAADATPTPGHPRRLHHAADCGGAWRRRGAGRCLGFARREGGDPVGSARRGCRQLVAAVYSEVVIFRVVYHPRVAIRCRPGRTAPIVATLD